MVRKLLFGSAVVGFTLMSLGNAFVAENQTKILTIGPANSWVKPINTENQTTILYFYNYNLVLVVSTPCTRAQ